MEEPGDHQEMLSQMFWRRFRSAGCHTGDPGRLRPGVVPPPAVLSTVFRTPVLLLHTTGRLTGVERTTPLAYDEDEDEDIASAELSLSSGSHAATSALVADPGPQGASHQRRFSSVSTLPPCRPCSRWTEPKSRQPA
jgi:hypothetical protein